MAQTYPTADGNLTDDVLDRLALDADAVALARRVDGEWQDVTIGEFHREVTDLAKGLMASGVEPGDRVVLLSKTRYEWTLADYAIWWAGAVTVPVYETSSPAQIAWILADSGAVAAVVETAEHAARVEEARTDAPDLKHVWTIDASTLRTRDRRRHRGGRRRSPTTRSTAAARPSVPTRSRRSSTRPAPPDAPRAASSPTATSAPSSPGPWSACPSCSIARAPRRCCSCRWPTSSPASSRSGPSGPGPSSATPPTSGTWCSHLGEFEPTFVLAVPRVFEKVFNTASSKAYADGRGKIFDRAVQTAISYSRAQDSGKPGVALRARHAVFDRLVYGKLREALGGHTEWAISGGAPLGERLAHFYRGIGVPVLEGYGLTETTAALCVNTPENQRIGTVGRLFPDTEVDVASDGELRFRGPQVFTGYWNNPAATAETLDADGWFSTGDLGDVDDDGFIRITGRKKEILVTAGGKNVAPAVLEDRIRAHPYVSQCLVVGDGKPFVAALVTIDTEAWTGSLDDPALESAVQEAIDDANAQVSQAEAIKKFVILPDDWTEQNGYLTPSFKVKRNAVLRDFHDTVEALFVR